MVDMMTSRGFAGLKRLKDEKLMPTSKIWKNKIKSERKHILWILWMDELKLESFDEVNVLLPRLLSILPPMGGIYLGWNH